VEERWPVELLERLAQKAGCGYPSDLRYLSPWEQFHLTMELVHIPAAAFSLKSWNDALAYLAGLSPEANASDAKERLIWQLSEHSGGLHRHSCQEYLLAERAGY